MIEALACARLERLLDLALDRDLLTRMITLRQRAATSAGRPR